MSQPDPLQLDLDPLDKESETLALSQLLRSRNLPPGTPTAPENTIMYLPPSFSKILAYAPYMSPLSTPITLSPSIPVTYSPPFISSNSSTRIYKRLSRSESSSTPTTEQRPGESIYVLPEIEVKRAQSLLLALVLSLAVLTGITILFTFLRHRAKMARDGVGKGDLESLDGYPSSEDDEVRRMKLRKSPRRKLRCARGGEKLEGRITGLEGVVRGKLLVPGERYGAGESYGGMEKQGGDELGNESRNGSGSGSGSGGRGHSRCASEGGASSKVGDRVRAGYDGFRGN